jgi:hypothetical protein
LWEGACRGGTGGDVLDLNGLDIDEIAMALADQTDYDHRWLINPRSGRLVLWTSDTGIDGEHPVDLEDLDLISIDPVPSYVWYQDMVDFAEGIRDRAAGRRLSASLQGKGAFRRFKNEVYGNRSELVSAWQAMRDAMARVRAVQWLVDEGLVDRVRRSTVHEREPGARPPLRPLHAGVATRLGCSVATVSHFAAIAFVAVCSGERRPRVRVTG